VLVYGWGIINLKRTIKNKEPIKSKAKRKVGRPSKYEQTFSTVELIYNLALLGAREVDIADVLGISISTMKNWKDTHPEFLIALNKGRRQADAVIAKSLFHRAKGYTHKDTDIRIYKGHIIKTPILKHYPPDTTAAIFWLKNRQRELWRDVHRTEHTGKDGGPIEYNFDVSELTDEELKIATDMGLKLKKQNRKTKDGHTIH